MRPRPESDAAVRAEPSGAVTTGSGRNISSEGEVLCSEPPVATPASEPREEAELQACELWFSLPFACQLLLEELEEETREGEWDKSWPHQPIPEAPMALLSSDEFDEEWDETSD
mmetsp:Transcript_3226/g.9890  ORF Transcript_3226/g.9890 Transcript_3226/m.9890 type:complete len:114 (+) Transcript_3226:1376-1717(+)